VQAFLTSLGPLAPLAVFLLATGESAAFLGLIIPGEVAVILGGVVAGAGTVPLWVMAVAAIAGAIAGDSIGYLLGSKTGPAMLARPRMAGLSKHLGSASELISERGWWALVAARFTSLLRAVVPFAAGSGGMPYGRFLIGNVIGGIAWGLTFTIAGYVAGANYAKVESWFRAGGLFLAGLIVVIGGLVWITRWASRNRGVVMDRIMAMLELRPIAFIIRRARTDARARTLLVGGIGVAGGIWLFAGLAQDVLGREEFFLFDQAVLRYLDTHPLPLLIDVSRFINTITAPPWVLTGAAVIVVIALARDRHRIAAAVAVAMVGQWMIVELVERLIQRVPPPFTPLAPRLGYGFPSEHVAAFATLLIVIVWPWVRPRWPVAMGRIGAAVALIVIVASARIVLLIEYPSDVTAATAVGIVWALLAGLVFDAVAGFSMSPDHVRPRRDRRGPS